MPDLNDLSTQGKATRPRGAVKLYDKDGIGQFITGWVSWEVDNNAYRAADTFRVVFATAMLPPSNDANWFATQPRMMVEIFATADLQGDDPYVPAPADSLIYGQVDAIDFDPVRGVIELTGRDLTALLIDTKDTRHWKEKRSSEIAEIIAKEAGLTPVVVPTKEVVGKYHEYDRVTLAQDQSHWEMLCYLANAEDFALYVKGKELHFEPRPTEQTDRYVIAWEPPSAERGSPVANVVSLQFSRALTIAKGITVEVRSWNAKQGGKPIIATFPKASKGAQPGQAAAKTQVYKRYFAHIDHAEAQRRAEAIYRQIIAHEMRMTGYLPADNVLDCSKTLLVRGTATAFDQVYYPENVTRTMSMTEGYRMNIRAKNTGPELEATQ